MPYVVTEFIGNRGTQKTVKKAGHADFSGASRAGEMTRSAQKQTPPILRPAGFYLWFGSHYVPRG
jgi:hypothetical protein